MVIQSPVIFAIGVIMSLITIKIILDAIRAHKWKRDEKRFKNGLVYGREAAPIHLDSVARMAAMTALIQGLIAACMVVAGFHTHSNWMEAWIMSFMGVVVFIILATVWIFAWHDLKKDLVRHDQKFFS